jgi:hypothetical protein
LRRPLARLPFLLLDLLFLPVLFLPFLLAQAKLPHQAGGNNRILKSRKRLRPNPSAKPETPADSAMGTRVIGVRNEIGIGDHGPSLGGFRGSLSHR